MTLALPPAYGATNSDVIALVLSAKKTHDPQQQYKLGTLFQAGIGVRKNPEKAKIWYYRAAKQDSFLAQTALGKMQLYGKGIPKNLTRAYFWLTAAAKQGHPEAQYELGNILRYGLGLPFQTSQGRRWYQKAAQQGYADAQYALATLYEAGIGAQVKLPRAKHWYQKAAQQGHAKAKQKLAKVFNIQPIQPRTNKNFQKEFRWAKKGDSKAQFRLGIAHLKGTYGEKNNDKAFHWIKKAAQKNHTNAQYQLGSFYQQGIGTNRDDIQAKHWLTKAARNKHKRSIVLLKQLAAPTKTIKQSPLKRPKKTPINTDNVHEQYHLGMIHLQGRGTDQDPVTAFKWLQKSAKQNHPQAQYILGTLYIDGVGTVRNVTLGSRWLEKAAKQGVLPAKTALHYMLEANVDLWYNAEKGNTQTQYDLANKFLANGRSEDIETAIKWLTQAAKNNHIDANHQLGKLYRTGTHIKQNNTVAFKWFKRAASLGNADSQYQIGLMYQEGIGTLSDQTLAQQWLQRAAQNKQNTNQ